MKRAEVIERNSDVDDIFVRWVFLMLPVFGRELRRVSFCNVRDRTQFVEAYIE